VSRYKIIAILDDSWPLSTQFIVVFMFNPSNMFYITEVSKLGFWNTDVSHNRSFPASQFLVPKSWCRNWPRNLVIDDLLVIYRDFCGFNGIYWWFNDGWLLTGLTPKRIYITGFSPEERPRCLVNFFKNSSIPVSSEKRNIWEGPEGLVVAMKVYVNITWLIFAIKYLIYY